MTSVASLLDDKGRKVWSVAPNDSVFNVIKLMDEQGIGALVVLQQGELIGIVSERDCARQVILKGRSPGDTPVSDIMSRRVYYVFPDEDIERCMTVMTNRRVRHLPVLEGKAVVGMVSLGDVVKHIIAEQRSTIEHLEHYISWEESY